MTMSSSALMARANYGGDAYTDLSSVQAIRAVSDKNQALQKVAQQFESMMLRTMMKSMRDANKVFSEGNYLSSHESDTYRDMLDDQLALTLSQGRGMGIAEVMARQLQRRYGNSANEPGADDNNLSDYLQRRNTIEATQPVQAATPGFIERVKELLPESIDFDGTVEKFVSHLYPLAEKAAQALGVDPRALLAQSALETGWGRKLSSDASGVSSLNFFNIKADRRWAGDSVAVSTLEVRDGVPVRERANFRAYQSAQHSFDDYVDFLTSNSRYEKAMQCSDSESFVKALAEAGYATDQQYAEKIISIMNDDKLNAAIDSVLDQPKSDF